MMRTPEPDIVAIAPCPPALPLIPITGSPPWPDDPVMWRSRAAQLLCDPADQRREALWRSSTASKKEWSSMAIEISHFIAKSEANDTFLNGKPNPIITHYTQHATQWWCRGLRAGRVTPAYLLAHCSAVPLWTDAMFQTAHAAGACAWLASVIAPRATERGFEYHSEINIAKQGIGIAIQAIAPDHPDAQPLVAALAANLHGHMNATAHDSLCLLGSWCGVPDMRIRCLILGSRARWLPHIQQLVKDMAQLTRLTTASAIIHPMMMTCALGKRMTKTSQALMEMVMDQSGHVPWIPTLMANIPAKGYGALAPWHALAEAGAYADQAAT